MMLLTAIGWASRADWLVCLFTDSALIVVCWSFPAVSGLLPAVTAVEGAGISPFSQLNVWRSFPAVVEMEAVSVFSPTVVA